VSVHLPAGGRALSAGLSLAPPGWAVPTGPCMEARRWWPFGEPAGKAAKGAGQPAPTLPEPRLFSPPPGLGRRPRRASRIFGDRGAAASSAARERPTVGMRGTGVSQGQVALERE
jgi:hypothetical protein